MAGMEARKWGLPPYVMMMWGSRQSGAEEVLLTNFDAA